MALTFPLDLILEGENWRCTRFVLGNAQNIGQSGGGTMAVVEVGVDLWLASYECGPLKPTEFDRRMALIHSLRGSMFSFLGWDSTRCRPIAYPSTAGPLPPDLVGRLVAVSQSRIVTIDQVSSGYQVRAGDYFRTIMNGRRYYFQFLENAVANASGFLNAVEVRPHVPSDWVLNSTVVLNKPMCLMRIVSGSLQAVRGPSGMGTIAFDAMQVLADPV